MIRTTSIKTWIFRLVLLVLLVLAVLIGFFWRIETNNSPATEQQFYTTLSYWNHDSSLAADELEADLYCYDVPDISKMEVAYSIEAEDIMERPKGIRFGNQHGQYQGSGYVHNLPANTQSAFFFPINVPATQHYDITICMAADTDVRNALRVNEHLLTTFSLDGTGKFTRVTFYGIFLEAGEAVVSIDTIDAGIRLDYLELINDTSIYDIDYKIEPQLCNPNATAAAQKLYSFLSEQWGKQIVTGQYASDERNRELSLIYQLTGQLPAIRFGELGKGDDFLQIEAAMDWHTYTGGIVGLMWQWNAPNGNSVYARDNHFNLARALYAIDIAAIAQKTPQELEALVAEETISADCYLLLQDIDRIAAELTKLANMDIPILWRPLHEASGRWYWWGAYGEEAYRNLWELLYQRLTNYHALNNLIWIWNGQSTSYLVPEDTYDIASVDVYLPADMTYSSRYEQFLSLSRITNGKKLLALSECSALPSIEMMMLDHTIWSFYGLWYGEYIMTSDGNFSDVYYSSSDLYNLYNSDRALCLNDFLSLCQ